MICNIWVAGDTHSVALSIWKQFLARDAATPVNIGSTTMRPIALAHETSSFGVDTFDTAAREVATMLHNEYITIFSSIPLISHLCYVCCVIFGLAMIAHFHDLPVH